MATIQFLLEPRFKNMKKIIITIGRQFGSGGVLVANELGNRLGIPVYDNELITKAAQDSGFSAEFFKQSDERKSFFSFFSMFSGADENCMSDNGLFKMQCETIRRIAEQGSAVIVGRCADYVLRDHDNIINIFLTSGLEARVQRVMQRDSISRDKALAKIEKKDRSREEYYNYYTFGNWGVASTYDLCLDSSILGIEGTADLIMEFIKKIRMTDE